jgi:hypothetical protein
MSDTSTMSQSHYSQSPGPPSLCHRPSLMVVSSPVLRTQPPDRRNSQVPMHDQHAPRACTALTTLPYDTPSFSRHVEHAGQVSRHVEHGDLRSIAVIPAACHASRRATIPCHRRRARSHPTCDTPACLCVSVRQRDPTLKWQCLSAREGRCPTQRQRGQLVLPNAMSRACSSRAGIVLPTACFPQL